MVPPRLARKMSVMSVEPPARGAPGGTAAERVHRPGSRRLGGVEATGASPGVAPSRPHRSDPRAGPVRRTPCARGAWGGERAGGLGLRLACRRELRGGAGLALLPVEVRLRLLVAFPPSPVEEKGYQSPIARRRRKNIAPDASIKPVSRRRAQENACRRPPLHPVERQADPQTDLPEVFCPTTSGGISPDTAL